MKVKIFPPRGCDRSALDERYWADLPEGSTVSDVLRIIKCSPVRAKLLLVSVNGEHSKLDHVLRDGDVVGFFSLVSGG
ncbi:MAG: MoaD/ThiS family protein [Mogibacterium sp.]|nr:MoaD/ThiS family protein [Mogibacterium sp.]